MLSDGNKTSNYSDKRPPSTHSERIIACFTIVLAIVSIIAGVVSYMQWQLGRSQLNFAIRQTDDSTKDTRESLRLSKISAESASRQASATLKVAKASDITAQASADQVENARRQTSAIVKQADALIRSAQATVKAAEAQLASAQANTKTAEAGARAAEAQLHSAQLISAAQAPSARLNAVEFSGWVTDADWRGAPDKDGKVSVKIKPSFVNNGGGDLTAKMSTFNVQIGTKISPNPPAFWQFQFGGNDLHIAQNGKYSPTIGFPYSISQAEIANIKTNKSFIFVWGITTFTDIKGTEYRVCYGAIAVPPSAVDVQGSVYRAGPDSYHCGGG